MESLLSKPQATNEDPDDEDARIQKKIDVIMSKREQQMQVRLMFLLKKSAVPDAPVVPSQIAELAEEALMRSGAEVHEHRVKCPKCRSIKVTLLQQLRRGGRIVQT